MSYCLLIDQLSDEAKKWFEEPSEEEPEQEVPTDTEPTE